MRSMLPGGFSMQMGDMLAHSKMSPQQEAELALGGCSLTGWRIPAAGGLFLQNIHPTRERFPMLS